ncbi:MAG: hypothetical protein NXI16_01485 [Alphaproteobacteria bacterium]|nr:hypothetical protein [Alphaproteobacteria bacterium]
MTDEPIDDVRLRLELLREAQKTARTPYEAVRDAFEMYVFVTTGMIDVEFVQADPADHEELPGEHPVAKH